MTVLRSLYLQLTSPPLMKTIFLKTGVVKMTDYNKILKNKMSPQLKQLMANWYRLMSSIINSTPAWCWFSGSGGCLGLFGP